MVYRINYEAVPHLFDYSHYCRRHLGWWAPSLAYPESHPHPLPQIVLQSFDQCILFPIMRLPITVDFISCSKTSASSTESTE